MDGKIKGEIIPLSLLLPVSSTETGFFVFATKIAAKIAPFLTEEEKAELSLLLNQMEVKYPYKLCKLNDKGGDLSKRWYIEFEVFNKDLGKVERKFVYLSAKLKTKEQRVAFANATMNQINGMLLKGFAVSSSPKKEERVKEKGNVIRFDNCLAEAYRVKLSGISNKKTKGTYTMYYNLVLTWMSETGNTNLLVQDFTKQMAWSLFEWLEEDFYDEHERRMSGRTYNNYRGFIFSLFNVLVKRDYFAKNPIMYVEERKVADAANFPFTLQQKTQLLTYMLEEKIMDMYYFCQFMYYTCSRPTEIIKLQRKHVFEDKIMFQGTRAKNMRTQFIPITKGCKELLVKMGVYDTAPDSYLFSRTGVGGKVPTGENQFGQRHTVILRKLGYSSDYYCYSWKDTGACDLYLATKDIMLVKDMCRHSSVAETEIYLRSMGMLVNYAENDNTPTLPV